MISLKNKRVAVLGLGVSGIESLKLLSFLGASTLAFNTGEPDDWAHKSGVLDFVSISNCFSDSHADIQEILQDVELLILSPGIPREHCIPAALIKRNLPVWGEIELAYRVLSDNNLLSPIIGITGTNGKTTTTTLLGEMIEAAGKTVFVGGNIGVPFSLYALNLLEKKNANIADFILLELSSFQLESIDEFRVDIAIFLNLYQNHGERYSDIKEYAKSKMLITNKFDKNSHLIISDQSSIVLDWAASLDINKTIISNSLPKIKFDLNKFKLPGLHNKINLAFALKVAKLIELDEKGILECINTFNGVEHRIEAVEGKNQLVDCRIFNDAKSTNWDATLTAVGAMDEYKSEIFLILGGKKRGHGDSIKPYFEYLNLHVGFFYLIGEMKSEIEKEFSELGLSEKKYFKANTLELAVEDFRQNRVNNQKSQILLFSPAFPSFDQFRSYVHRGEVFKSCVNK